MLLNFPLGTLARGDPGHCSILHRMLKPLLGDTSLMTSLRPQTRASLPGLRFSLALLVSSVRECPHPLRDLHFCRQPHPPPPGAGPRGPCRVSVKEGRPWWFHRWAPCCCTPAYWGAARSGGFAEWSSTLQPCKSVRRAWPIWQESCGSL